MLTVVAGALLLCLVRVRSGLKPRPPALAHARLSVAFMICALLLHAGRPCLPWPELARPLSGVFALAAVALERRLPGAKLIALGLAANLLTMLVFGGHFPVTLLLSDPGAARAATNGFYFLASPGQAGWWMGDWIPIAPFGPGHLASPGDLAVFGGAGRLLWSCFRPSFTEASADAGGG